MALAILVVSNQLTPAQTKALAEIRRLATEHFDAWILNYRLTNESLGSKVGHEFHGQISDIVGMNAIAQRRLEDYASLRGGDV